MSSPTNLRDARKQRIAARNLASAASTTPAVADAADTSQEAKSAFNYNPLYQKPTHLGPDAPRGGYHYYGPPPDAGTSYGCFAGSDGIGVIMPINKGEDGMAKAADQCAYNPQTGEQIKLVAELDKDGLATVLSNCDKMIEIPGTSPSIVTSAPLDTMPVVKMYHPATGADISEIVKNMKPEQAQAVKYEALSSFIPSESISEDDVHATLYAESSADPYWNIEIKGRPVASVHLADQPKPDEMRQLFVSADYFRGVSGAIAKLGPEPVLTQIKARLWANEINKTALAKQIRAQVENELKAKFDKGVQGVADRLLHCVAVVNAGMDKNFFQDVDHPLKEALYNAMASYGVPVSHRMALIEAGFEAGATNYFKTVFEKAIEFLGVEPVALAQIEQAIGTADILRPEVPGSSGTDLAEASAGASDNPMTEPTLSRRLAQSSVPVTSSSTFADNSFGEHKASLREELQLGGATTRQK